jgi:flagellar biosynthetic protein FliP
MRKIGLLLVTLLTLIATPAFAQVSLNIGGENGSVTGNTIQIVALMTVLSLAPSILMMMTSFTRIIVVFSFLRSAIGIQQTPPNAVLISLAMFLTLFIMMPTFQASYTAGIEPMMNESMPEMEAMTKAVQPFKKFMLENTREKDLKLFVEINKAGPFKDSMETPLQYVIPAFMISELRRAFEIGFLLFLPFLVIDMVVSSILMSMGMMMLPPVMISLPFKIIFFVLVDGWYLITGSLIQSYGVGG